MVQKCWITRLLSSWMHSFFTRTIKRFPIFGVLRLVFVFISISYMHLSLQFIFIFLPTFISTFTLALYKMLGQGIKFESNAFFTRIIFLLVVLRDCHFYDFLDLIRMFLLYTIRKILLSTQLDDNGRNAIKPNWIEITKWNVFMEI